MSSWLNSLFSYLIPSDLAVGTWYYPSADDVHEVRQYLLQYLPLELVNFIIDEAEYWPRLVVQTNRPVPVRANGNVNRNARLCYLLTPPIPNYETAKFRPLRVKKVVFRMRSHDQGWGGDAELEGPYDGSYTWFEATVYKNNDTSLVPQPFEKVSIEDDERRYWIIQRNVRASSAEREHQVIWSDDSDIGGADESLGSTTASGSGYGTGFVKCLMPGDRIAVMARAMFPLWVNYVLGVDIEVFYSV